MGFREGHYRRALRSAEGFLLLGEEVVIASNRHWIVIFEPVLTCVLSFLLIVRMNATTSTPGTDLFWWLWFAILARTAWRVIEWRRAWFIATNHRFLKITGIFVRRVAMMPVKKVTDITYNRTIPGQILRYGTFRFETAGQDQAFSQLRQMPHPNELYQAIVKYVLGTPPKPAPVPPPAPTKPMRFDFGDRSRSRDSDLYQGGSAVPATQSRSGGEPENGPDTEPFVIPDHWRRTDHEVASPQQQPHRQIEAAPHHAQQQPHRQIEAAPHHAQQQPEARAVDARWISGRAHTDDEHRSTGFFTRLRRAIRSLLRGATHEDGDRYGKTGSGPIIEGRGLQRGHRRAS